MLVPGEDEHGLAPLRRGSQSAHHLLEEGLADDDVLRVLLRLGVEVGIEEAEARERAVGRVSEKAPIGFMWPSASSAVSGTGKRFGVAPVGELST